MKIMIQSNKRVIKIEKIFATFKTDFKNSLNGFKDLIIQEEEKTSTGNWKPSERAQIKNIPPLYMHTHREICLDNAQRKKQVTFLSIKEMKNIQWTSTLACDIGKYKK